MTVRSPESVRNELDYWKVLLDDLRDVNDLLNEAAEPLPHVGNAAMAMALGDHDKLVRLEAAAKIENALIASMRALLRVDEGFHRILALIEGRQLALEQEETE